MNLLPLESFRRILGFHPYHFYGLENSKIRVNSACNTLLSEYSWQAVDAAGRDDIRRAIETAENRLRDYLLYWPAPKYVEETVPWPKYYDEGVWRVRPLAGDGRRISVTLPDGHTIATGIEQITSIGTAAVTLSDQDSDTLYDTFTISIATTETDPTKLAVYFVSADRFDDTRLGERWRIQPVTITISAGTATIKGRSWNIIKPILYEGVLAPQTALDPDTTSNYAANLEVCTRKTYQDGETIDNAQGVLLWETTPCAGWFCICTSCGVDYSPTDSSRDPSAVGTAIARVGIRDSKIGLVIPDHALRNATTGIWYSPDWYSYREPDRVKVRYLAGLPLDANGQMPYTMQVVVARLAMAELARPICGCDTANRELWRWQFDLGRAAGANDEQYQISPEDLNNPFGTRAGAVYAWKQVKNMRLERSLHF